MIRPRLSSISGEGWSNDRACVSLRFTDASIKSPTTQHVTSMHWFVRRQVRILNYRLLYFQRTEGAKRIIQSLRDASNPDSMSQFAKQAKPVPDCHCDNCMRSLSKGERKAGRYSGKTQLHVQIVSARTLIWSRAQENALQTSSVGDNIEAPHENSEPTLVSFKGFVWCEQLTTPELTRGP